MFETREIRSPGVSESERGGGAMPARSRYRSYAAAGARSGDVGLEAALVGDDGHADGERGSVAEGERGSAPSCSSERTSRPSARWSRSADTSRSAGTFCGARTTRPPAAMRTDGGLDFW